MYEHVREGFSDKPDLDMRLVCEETDKVIANVEGRKGDLRGEDVHKIVRLNTFFKLSYPKLLIDVLYCEI